ncbi:MAG TPA: hypothetical protein PL120_02715 [Bacilli bacterium]|jgi:16S rRNA C967 or C1407 C5-methylase (RsmB/RsmF family)|nr:hypothetical protein [Bacilli bacterium]
MKQVKIIIEYLEKILSGEETYSNSIAIIRRSKEIQNEDERKLKFLLRQALLRRELFMYFLSVRLPEVSLSLKTLAALLIYFANSFFLKSVEIDIDEFEAYLLSINEEEAKLVIASNLLLESDKNALYPTKSHYLSPLNLSLRYNCPLPLIEFWIEELGKKQTIKTLDATRKPFTICGRINAKQVNVEELFEANKDFKPSVLKNSYVYSSKKNIKQTAPYKEMSVYSLSLYEAKISDYIQSLNPRSVVCFEDEKSSLFLDLAIQCETDTHISVVTTSRRRFAICNAIKLKFKLDNVDVLYLNKIEEIETLGKFDVVYYVAPSSNYNAIRLSPDFFVNWKIDIHAEKAAFVKDRLASLIPLVAPQGFLLFNVTTYTSIETHEQAEAFANEHPQFALALTMKTMPYEIDNALTFTAVFAHLEKDNNA